MQSDDTALTQAADALLVGQYLEHFHIARNTIWSIQQGEGFQPPKIASHAFKVLLKEMLDDPDVGHLLQPLATITAQIDQQVAELKRAIAARAKASVTCRRLMSAPGVGPLVALTYVSAVDQPERFHNARTVGAHFGLTPRRHQSGELDWSGRISRTGDAAVRRALYQAANVLLHHSKR